MRTFEFSDGRSNKFWNIELSGTEITITSGRIGTAGRTETKPLPNPGAARREHDRLIAEQTEKGYRETTPPPPTPVSQTCQGLRAALAENPDDLASHMAYADYLTEQGDPLGEFIRVQLALEEPDKAPEEREKLRQREKGLLDAHAPSWLGELAPFLLDNAAGFDLFQVEFSFRRGWLDALKAEFATFPFCRALGRAPVACLLRRLEITSTHWADNRNPLEPLANAPTLANVRMFLLGMVVSPEEDDHFLQDGPTCNCGGAGAVAMVKGMPRLEELRLLCHQVETAQLFALETLGHLRLLQVDHNHDYPLEVLANNPSLGNLTHLLCWPHALEVGHAAYIGTAGVRAVVTSPHLRSLTHLRLRCCDMGDEGVREIITSSILKRLVWLDLRHGNVTDEGALALADALAVTSLRRLDLCNNALTERGIQALRATGVQRRADGQHDADDPERQYLYCGDYE
jgi:uncharacterized protein (TIGR02996 family)